ncbi:MAG TPA: hypothetical protein VNH45_03990 [Gaiellaceae bacterium]|nr:hypothetical protein [Gaiellaceae bacterium]
MKLKILGACALVVLACVLANASAMAAGSATSATVLYDCGKLLPTSRLAALTGGTFTKSYARSIPAGSISLCGYDGTAGSDPNATPADAMHPDIAMHIIAGTSVAAKKAIARDWLVYAQPAGSGKVTCTPPRDPRDCVVQPLAGVGDRAAEFNDYIVVQKGSAVFQIWAGNNGAHHLSYDQLEAVAKYLLTKIK